LPVIEAFRRQVVKILSVVALFSVLVLALASLAGAAPAQKLQTFGTGKVALTAADSATIVIEPGQYGGVYVNSKSQGGKTLDQVSFGFTSSGDVQGGAPRFSLPIDDPATAVKGDGYAFLDAAGCGAAVGDNVSDQKTRVSTSDAACQVQYKDGSYANWAAFAEANPTLITTPGAIPFIIADWTPENTTGTFIVSNIVLR
jgi:hypothetical protein